MQTSVPQAFPAFTDLRSERAIPLLDFGNIGGRSQRNEVYIGLGMFRRTIIPHMPQGLQSVKYGVFICTDERARSRGNVRRARLSFSLSIAADGDAHSWAMLQPDCAINV